jgi:hypothetical protein
MSSNQNMHLRAKIHQFRPFLAGTRRFWAGITDSRPTWADLGKPAPARSSSPGWAGFSVIPAGSSRPLRSRSARLFWPPLWATGGSWPRAPALGWAEEVCPRLGLSLIAAACRAIPPAGPGCARPLLFAGPRPACVPQLGRASAGRSGRPAIAWTESR